MKTKITPEEIALAAHNDTESRHAQKSYRTRAQTALKRKIKKASIARKQLNTTSKSTDYKESESYLNLNTMRKQLISPAWYEQLGRDMIKWAQENDDAIVFNTFLNKNGIYKGTFQRWCKKNSILLAAYNITLQIIGSRREEQAAKRKLDPSMIKFNQGKYDPEWKEQEIWKETIKAEIQENIKNKEDNIQKVIVIEKFKDEK